MKHRFLLIVFVCALFYTRANNGLQKKDSAITGVRFDNGRWEQVLKKAKKEKKYIFVDCYTTWCGPCKEMEKRVYIQQVVGDYVNKHFISVKMQMDKAANDDQLTKSRYSDADLIQKQNGIPAYPTYFIFSPSGKLLSRGTGYKSPEDFLGFVSSGIDPNAVHPYARYYGMLAEYQAGKKDYSVMKVLLDTATMLGQGDMADSIQKDYSAYLKTLSDDQLYTPEIISYLALRVQNSSSRYFHLFHPNEARINALMGKNGYAQLVVGRIITSDDIAPFVHLNTGLACAGCPVKKDADPDWVMIEKAITGKYDSSYAEENMLKVKARWYGEHNDRANSLKYFTMLVQKYSVNMDANSNDCADFMDCDLNSWCWVVFKYSVDKGQIDVSIKCMDGVLKRYKERDGKAPEGFIDTYANLLYKAGRTEEALNQEMGILEYLTNVMKVSESDMKDYKDTIEKMKQGKPTWPHYISDDDFFGMGLM